MEAKVEITNKPEPETLESVVGQAIGEASMCWSETPAGVFESTRALEIREKILAAVQRENVKLLTQLLKRQQSAASDYRQLMKHTGGLIATSMTMAYSKGMNDTFKFVAKLFAEGAKNVETVQETK